MRVDMITKEYPPEIYGGAGVHVTELVRALREGGAGAPVDVNVRAFGADRDEPGTTSYRVPAELTAANAAVQTLGTDLEIVYSVWNPTSANWRVPGFVERIDNFVTDTQPQVYVCETNVFLTWNRPGDEFPVLYVRGSMVRIGQAYDVIWETPLRLRDDSCIVSLLTPARVLDWDLRGDLTSGTAGRVLACQPE